MSAQSTAEPRTNGTELEDLAPSAKLVLAVLEHEGEQTQSELGEATMLPSRTLRYGITQLEERGVVDSRISLRDARQRIYSLEGTLAD